MNKYIRFCFTLLWAGLPLLSVVLAQQRNPLNPQIGSTRQDSIPEGIMPLDTPVAMSYILIKDPKINYSFSDSFKWKDVRHFPIEFDQAHLGNYGSATRSLTPSISSQIGFSTGWFQFDPYFIHPETFKYYNQNTPVTKIKYSQASQEDTYLTLDFGRNFAKGINFAIAYNRSNQVGEFGHQRQKNTGFGIGVWHHAPSGKYDGFYNLISNAAVSQENGGVATPDLIGDPLYPSDLDVPVFITSGLTNHKHRIFLTKHIFHLLADTSSFGIDLWLQGKLSSGFYKYVDIDAATIPAYYGSGFLIDQRGIRQYTYEKENQWSLGLSLPWKRARSTIHGSLRYRGIALDQEPIRRNINEVYLDLGGDFQWVEALKLSSQFSLGLGQADGSFSFKAEGDLKTGNLGHLLGSWSIVSRKPYMIESTLYVNQQSIYNADFRNLFMNEIGLSWDFEKQMLTAGITWSVFENYIYFDSVSLPNQVDGSFSLRRFFVSKAFDFKWIGFQAKVIWQPDPPDKLAVPELLYSTSLFGRIKFFDQKVTFMPGIDVTYHGGYTGVTYFPVTGAYHLTDGMDIPDYLRIDVGLGLQINFLKVFARMDDVVGMIQDRVLYQADFYPHYRGYFRMGVEARFFN